MGTISPRTAGLIAFAGVGIASAVTLAAAAPATVEWHGEGKSATGVVTSENRVFNKAIMSQIALAAAGPVGLAGAVVGNLTLGSPLAVGFGAALGMVGGMLVGSQIND